MATDLHAFLGPACCAVRLPPYQAGHVYASQSARARQSETKHKNAQSMSEINGSCLTTTKMSDTTKWRAKTETNMAGETYPYDFRTCAAIKTLLHALQLFLQPLFTPQQILCPFFVFVLHQEMLARELQEVPQTKQTHDSRLRNKD